MLRTKELEQFKSPTTIVLKENEIRYTKIQTIEG